MSRTCQKIYDSSSTKPLIISVESFAPATALPYQLTPSTDVAPSHSSNRGNKSEKDTEHREKLVMQHKRFSSRKIKKFEESDTIPLHKGSAYRVSKTDLIRIYTSQPAVYTVRLADLVFGKDTLASVSKVSCDGAINLLDQNKMESFVSELVTSIMKL